MIIELACFIYALRKIRAMTSEHGNLLIKEKVMVYHIIFFGFVVAAVILGGFAIAFKSKIPVPQPNSTCQL
jgi:hypothetical protein